MHDAGTSDIGTPAGSDDADSFRLRMEGVKKAFGATKALKGVDFSVRPGEVLALVGENGAGKSTLMKVLSGAHKSDEGKMWLEGRPFQPAGPLDARDRGVVMIYQELSLAPHLSVMENICLGVESRKGPFILWEKMKSRTLAALQEVGLEEVSPETEVRRLRIAQQQLVEIARAVAQECRVLVLDEPTSSLTLKDTKKLFLLIRRLKARGLSIVYISHFLEEVQEISDRFTVLRDGESVGEGITSEVEVDRIIEMMVGREVKDLYPRSRRTPGEVILELSGVAGLQKPSNASLELRRGEVLGIAGLVGAGRTELMRAIFGLDAVRTGKIRVEHYVGAASPSRRWSQGMGMVSEDRKTEGLAVGLSIADNITLSRLSGLGPWRFVLPSLQDRAAEPWIRKIPIRCQSATQRVQALSGGNQQKVAIARLLHAEVDVLLLDEPTRGIDVGSKAQIYQLIDELAVGDEASRRTPRAILMISSYLPELLGVCDRIAVMCRGVLSAARDVSECNEHALMMTATGQE